jgi:hypothetical protein
MEEKKEEPLLKTVLKASRYGFGEIASWSAALSVLIGFLLLLFRSDHGILFFIFAIALLALVIIANDLGYNNMEWELDWEHGFIQVKTWGISPTEVITIWMGEIDVNSVYTHNYRVWFKDVTEKWYSIKCVTLPCGFLEKFLQAVKKTIDESVNDPPVNELIPEEVSFTTYLKHLGTTPNKQFKKLSNWKRHPSAEIYYYYGKSPDNEGFKLWKAELSACSSHHWNMTASTMSGKNCWKHFAKEHQLVPCKIK